MEKQIQMKLMESLPTSSNFIFKISNSECYYNIEKIDNSRHDLLKKFKRHFIEFNEDNVAYDSVIDWIKNKSSELKNQPIFSLEESMQIADFFLDNPVSLEILFKLEIEGNQTIKQITEEYEKITDLLIELLKFDLIVISNRRIRITNTGTIVVKRFLNKI